jgi:hypothetical protein
MVENITEDDPALSIFKANGFSESFRRVEMHRFQEQI